MAMMKKLTSALVASSLVLGLVGTAGATTPDKVNTAASRMAALGLVQGKGGSDLALGDSITRAELVTVIVRAFGQDTNARYLTGVNTFPDTADHWASGYVTMAHKLITERSNGAEVVGYPDGTFKPEGQVTTAEAIAFLMKFTGAPKDNSLPYPDNYLQGAVNAGLITAEDLANIEGIKNAPATRGLAFYLADSAFANYKLAEGSSTYRTFVDRIAPSLSLTTEAPAAPTTDSKITITGKVTDAASVFVGTPANTATIAADGTFSIDVELAMGENNIVVTAVDLVGNTTEATLKVTRTAGAADHIQAEDITVTAGSSIDVIANVVDAMGNVIEGEIISGQSEIGTYADGKFTAGTKAGKGTLVLKSGELSATINVTITAGDLANVVAESGFAPGKAVRLIGVDAYGNPVDGVSFSEDYDNAYIEGDRFVATAEGTYTITATKGDITVQGVVGAFGDVDKLVVEAPESIVANGETVYTVTVKAVDANGLLVADFNGYVSYEGDLVIDSQILAHAVDGDEIVEMNHGIATIAFKAPTSVEDLEEAELEFTLYEDLDDAKADDDDVADIDVTLSVEEQVATTFSLEADKYLPVNLDIPAEVTVYVYDQVGVEMESGAWDFEIKIKGPAELHDDTDDAEPTLENGESFKLQAKDEDETGDVVVTVTSTDDELKGLKAELTIQAVVAGNAKGITLSADDDKVEAGEENTYTIQFVDKNGVPTESGEDREITVTFEGMIDTSAAAVDFTVEDSEGHAVAYELDGNVITFDLAEEDYKAVITVTSKRAGVYAVIAEAEDLGKSNSVSSSVVANTETPHYVAFKADEMFVLKGSKVTLVAQLYDEYGNPVARSGMPITFTSSDYTDLELNGDDDEVTVETDGNGEAVVTVDLARKASGTYTIAATAETDLVDDNVTAGLDFNAHLSSAVDLTVVDTIPVSMNVEIVDGTGRRISKIGVGEEAYLKVTFKDDEGDKIEGAADGHADAVGFTGFANHIKAESDRVNDSVGAFEWSDALEGWITPLNTAMDLGRGNYTVEYLGIEKALTKTGALTLEAGDVATVAIEDAEEESGVWVVEAKPNKMTEIALQLVDEADNLVTRSKVDSDYVIVFKPASGGITFFDADDEALDEYTVGGDDYQGILIKKGRNGAAIQVLANANDLEFDAELYEVDASGDLHLVTGSARTFQLHKD